MRSKPLAGNSPNCEDKVVMLTIATKNSYPPRRLGNYYNLEKKREMIRLFHSSPF